MSLTSKVMWSEGMFLKPQHFQQQDRYMEHYVDGRCQALSAYAWGINKIKIDHELLKLGKVSLVEAQGVFPDGTPFDIPGSGTLPKILEVPKNIHNETLYLALPVRRNNANELTSEEQRKASARYVRADTETYDVTTDNSESASVQVGSLNLRVLRSGEDLSGYACIGIAKIEESRADGLVILDNNYIPSVTDMRANSVLYGFASELLNLLEYRGQSLASRLVGGGRGGASDISDYLLLQVINRFEALVNHFVHMQSLHPIDFYAELVQMLGELSTFTSETKRPPSVAAYQHDDLNSTFSGLFGLLRESLSTVMKQTAVPQKLVERRQGIHVSPITDRSLLDSAMFVIAAKAQVPANQLRARFPGQVKIAPVEKIREVVNTQTPGIGMIPLPVAPRNVPYHQGMSYFELDKSGTYWQDMARSGGFAVHVGNIFPGLELELWAIRQ